MATANQRFMIGWSNHSNNFSHSFSDLLDQNELIDVTLAADGYLVNAHRLVLSALSPYFREMFTSMPANQQAFVFMKDVSKQTLQDLITFIYRGEVNVNQNNLEVFFNTAKALKIKGLTDESFANTLNVQTPKSTWPEPVQKGCQYQSSQTVQVENSAPPNYFQESSKWNPVDQHKDNFDYGENYETAEKGYALENNQYDNMNDGTTIVQENQWDSNYHADNGTVHQQEIKQNAPKAKRAKRKNGTAKYVFVADIRKNTGGRENLYHSGHKYSKNGHGLQKQLWRCSKSGSAKCSASASTKNINGVIMMKLLKDEHSHEPDHKPDQ